MAKTTSTWQVEAPALSWHGPAVWSSDLAEVLTMGDWGKTLKEDANVPFFLRILRLCCVWNLVFHTYMNQTFLAMPLLCKTLA